jgi:hypothetical protein
VRENELRVVLVDLAAKRVDVDGSKPPFGIVGYGGTFCAWITDGGGSAARERERERESTSSASYSSTSPRNVLTFDGSKPPFGIVGYGGRFCAWITDGGGSAAVGAGAGAATTGGTWSCTCGWAWAAPSGQPSGTSPPAAAAPAVAVAA